METLLNADHELVVLVLLDLIVDVPGDRVDLCARLLQVGAVRVEARRGLDDVIQQKLVARHPLDGGDQQRVQLPLHLQSIIQ